MEEDDNEMYQTHFAKYLESEVTAENLEETWQKVSGGAKCRGGKRAARVRRRAVVQVTAENLEETWQKVRRGVEAGPKRV